MDWIFMGFKAILLGYLEILRKYGRFELFYRLTVTFKYFMAIRLKKYTGN